MGHQYPDTFGLPAEFFGIDTTDVLVVDIAVYAAQESKFGQPAGEVRCAEVAGMPDFVTGIEVVENSVVEYMMCIG
jgi:hypothetical protein